MEDNSNGILAGETLLVISQPFSLFELLFILSFFDRDHPQMVRLSRMPGEFSISDIRESFIRQFTGSNSGLNLVVDTQDQPAADGTTGEGGVLSPQVRSTCLKLTKSPKHDTRCGGAVEKKMAICGIIRYCQLISPYFYFLNLKIFIYF